MRLRIRGRLVKEFLIPKLNPKTDEVVEGGNLCLLDSINYRSTAVATAVVSCVVWDTKISTTT
jgi:hypothetical protein